MSSPKAASGALRRLRSRSTRTPRISAHAVAHGHGALTRNNFVRGLGQEWHTHSDQRGLRRRTPCRIVERRGSEPVHPLMTPTEITLRKNSRMLVVAFEDGAEFSFSFEYLRVHSPSAEVIGHGPGQETLQTGKENVAITAIDPVGHYAVRLVFDDGHDTGFTRGPICTSWGITWRRTGNATSTASQQQGMLAKSPNNKAS